MPMGGVMSTETKKNGTFEREVRALSGWIMLAVNIALVIGAVVFLISTIGAGARHEIAPPAVGLRVIGAIVWLVSAIVSSSGHFTLQPNEARLLILFGSYKGTVRRSGFYWANPFYSRYRGRTTMRMAAPPSDQKAPTSIGFGRQGGLGYKSAKISLRAHNFNSEKLKVNDK